MDGDALPVELGEWLLGSVWGGVHYDQRLSRDRHGGETYTLINPREIHPEAEVDTRGVLRAAYVAAAVDSARTLRSIAQRFELLTDELLYEREPDETPPDDVARFGGGGGGVEVFPALKRLLATGDWEGAENDGDALEVAWRILKIIEGSAPVPAPDADMEPTPEEIDAMNEHLEKHILPSLNRRREWDGDKPRMMS